MSTFSIVFTNCYLFKIKYNFGRLKVWLNQNYEIEIRSVCSGKLRNV